MSLSIDHDYVGVGPSGEISFVGQFPGAPFDERLVLHSGGGLATDSPTLVFADDFCPRRAATGAVWNVDRDVLQSNGVAGFVGILERTTITPLGRDTRAWEPCISFNGAHVVFAAEHDKFYLHDGVTAEGFIQAGDPSPRGGGATVTTLLEEVRYKKRGVAFQVGDDGPFVPGLLPIPQVVGWRATASSTIHAIVASTDPVPAPIGGVFDLRGRAGIALHGRVVYFMGYVSSGAVNEGLFFRNGPRGPIRVIAVDGTPAVAGLAFASFHRDEVHVERGRVLFAATLDNGDDGIFLIRRTGSQPPIAIAKAGDPAPGTGGDTFEKFGRLGLNPQLEVVFAATTANGVDGVWFWSGGVITKVALEGEPAPAAVGGSFQFPAIEYLPLSSGRRRLALFGSWSPGGSADEALTRFDLPAGTLSVTVAAPGTAAPQGGTFTHVDLGQRAPIARMSCEVQQKIEYRT